MDTCDYVFYNADAVTLPQQQQQQRVDSAAGNGNSSSKDANSTAVVDVEGSSDSSSSSSNGFDTTPAAAAAAESPRFGYELQPVAVLLPPDGMKLTRGLPSRWLGSDHVCLVVDFELSLTNKDL
jgi:hypothetical protein